MDHGLQVYPNDISNVDDLGKALNWVRSLGWVKAISSGPHSVGTTLELLLGHPLDSLPLQDFPGAELKAQREITSSPITLFTKTPDWREGWSAKRVTNTFGYADDAGHDKALRINLYHSRSMYGMRLKPTDIGFCVYVEDTGEVIGEWSRDVIGRKFNGKAKDICYVKADTKVVEGEEYFHYTEADFCARKPHLSRDDMIRALENNDLHLEWRMYIRVDHPHCRKKTGEMKGPVGSCRDHGPGFRIRQGKVRSFWDITEFM